MSVKLDKTGFQVPTNISSTIFSWLSHKLSLFILHYYANDFYIHIYLNIQICH